MAITITVAEINALPQTLQQTWANLMAHCGLKESGGKFVLDENRLAELREDPSCRKGLRLFLRASSGRRLVESLKSQVEKGNTRTTASRSRKRTSTEAKRAAKAAELAASGDDPPAEPGKKRNDK